jgi:hypothetical protein
MIKVKVCRNYKYPPIEKQSPLLDGVWNNIQLSEQFEGVVDFCVILNHPTNDVRIKVNQGGTWLFLQEPPDPKNVYFKNYFKFADQIYSGFGNSIQNGIKETISLPWHINKTYQELKELDINALIKDRDVSWITSNNNMFSGHEVRLSFIEFLRLEKFEFDLYGRGFNPIDDKFQGLKNYKYSIAAENYSADDYWTEKIQDCFLSWCMPIYYGCTNLEKYFPKESYIQVDLNDRKGSLQIIKEAIKNDLWSKNKDAIAESRRLILDQYQLFPYIERLISKYNQTHLVPKKTNLYIPNDGLDSWQRFKHKLHRAFSH